MGNKMKRRRLGVLLIVGTVIGVDFMAYGSELSWGSLGEFLGTLTALFVGLFTWPFWLITEAFTGHFGYIIGVLIPLGFGIWLLVWKRKEVGVSDG